MRRAAASTRESSLYTACLRLRMEAPEFRSESRDTWQVERLTFDVGAIRFGGRKTRYLLLFDFAGAHFGRLRGESIAHLPEGECWERLLSSNAERFGGTGMSGFDADTMHCDFRNPETVVLRSRF